MAETLYQFLVLSAGLAVAAISSYVLRESRKHTQQSLTLQKLAVARNGIYKDETFFSKGPHVIFFHDHIRLEVLHQHDTGGLPIVTVRGLSEYPVTDALTICSKSIINVFSNIDLVTPLRETRDLDFDKTYAVQSTNAQFTQNMLDHSLRMYLRAMNKYTLAIKIQKADKLFRKEELPYIYFKESSVEVIAYQIPRYDHEYEALINTAILICNRIKELMEKGMDNQINRLNLEAATPTESQSKLLRSRSDN